MVFIWNLLRMLWSKIILAKKEFDAYLNKKFSETKNINKLVKGKYNLNDRQIQLLQFYIGNSEEYTTTKNHMEIARISKMTAIRDLKELEKLGFLYSRKNGKNILYFGTEKIKEFSK